MNLEPSPEGWRVPVFAELDELCRNHSSRVTDVHGCAGYWFCGAKSYSKDVYFNEIEGYLFGTDEDIKSTIRTFSKYINVDMKVFENNQQEYVEKIKAYMPYSSTEVFNNKLIDINLIIKIT